MRSIRAVLIVATLLTAFSLPTAASAYDGEVIKSGNNVAGEVYLVPGGKARINFNNLGDCPAGLGNGCWVEVRFLNWCEEPWCLTPQVSPTLRVPFGQDFYQYAVCKDDRNRWEVQVRVHYQTATTHTVEFWGQTELSLGVGAFVSKFLFDVTTGTGFRGGSKSKTVIARDAYSDWGTLGVSNGYLQGPASC